VVRGPPGRAHHPPLTKIEGAIAVRTPALGEAVSRLAWLPPRATSLVALARSPIAAAWAEIRADPGAVLLVARTAAAARSLPSFFPALLHDPAILEAALRHLDDDAGRGRDAEGGPELTLPCASCLPPPEVDRAALRYAGLAQRLAERTGRCDPENAWVAGLLAPLGWLAVGTVAPDEVARCLADPAHAPRPAETEQAHWGHDQAALARRLARRWRLPDWLAAVAGHLGLPVTVAGQFGADPALFQVAQLAVGLAQQQGVRLNLAVGAGPAELAAALGLPAGELTRLAAAGEVRADTRPPPGDAGPVPLLRDLLALAAENRRLHGGAMLRRLEGDLDDLHRALEEQRRGEAERLLAQKLAGLAEFAAGAGHEINNPLAVISGQAQYLLQHEADSSRQRALQTIIQQSQRIHQTLRDLMQFARPARPHKHVVDLLPLVQEVVVALGDLAGQRRVGLTAPDHDPANLPVLLHGDPGQLRNLLTCLLRNAVEAAPADGWARVRLEAAAADLVEVVVEDSGPGPDPAQQEHLFEPFYSGRQAGRGRGLGLPIAWRLAREHGGSVRFSPLAEGPTRFVLTLPRHREPAPTANGHGPHLPEPGGNGQDAACRDRNPPRSSAS
jgi:signal transduction histidine kinase